MRKVITPIVYAVLWLPIGMLIVQTLSTGEVFAYNFLQSLSLYRIEDIVIVLLFALIGIPILWYANKLMARHERLKKVSLFDHLRQSSLLYLVVLLSPYSLIRDYSEYGGGLHYGLSLGIWLYALIALVVNAYFLVRLKKDPDLVNARNVQRYLAWVIGAIALLWIVAVIVQEREKQELPSILFQSPPYPSSVETGTTDQRETSQ